MEQIILTGFEPFGPYKFNPTKESTINFDNKIIDNYKVSGVVLPCTYFGAFEILKKLILEIKPVAIISTGLSSSVKGIRFESTSINCMDGKYADANGDIPKGEPLIKNGKEFLSTNSNNFNLVNILHKFDIPCELSTNADKFICNSLIYLTTNYLQKNIPDIKNVFFHTPWTENYASLIELEPNKIMIPKKKLYHSIELVIKNVLKD